METEPPVGSHSQLSVSDRMPEKINLKEEKLFGLIVSIHGSLTLLLWVVVGQYIIAEMW